MKTQNTLQLGFRARHLAVEGSNNVIVIGTSGGDYVTIKYSSAGAPRLAHLQLELSCCDEPGPGRAENPFAAPAKSGISAAI